MYVTKNVQKAIWMHVYIYIYIRWCAYRDGRRLIAPSAYHLLVPWFSILPYPRSAAATVPFLSLPLLPTQHEREHVRVRPHAQAVGKPAGSVQIQTATARDDRATRLDFGRASRQEGKPLVTKKFTEVSRNGQPPGWRRLDDQPMRKKRTFDRQGPCARDCVVV